MNLDLKKLKEVGEKATEGPWIILERDDNRKNPLIGKDNTSVCTVWDAGISKAKDEFKGNDRSFIMESRNNWSTMIEALEEAEEIIDDLIAHGDGDISVAQYWRNKYFGDDE